MTPNQEKEIPTKNRLWNWNGVSAGSGSSNGVRCSRLTGGTNFWDLFWNAGGNLFSLSLSLSFFLFLCETNKDKGEEEEECNMGDATIHRWYFPAHSHPMSGAYVRHLDVFFFHNQKSAWPIVHFMTKAEALYCNTFFNPCLSMHMVHNLMKILFYFVHTNWVRRKVHQA